MANRSHYIKEIPVNELFKDDEEIYQNYLKKLLLQDAFFL